MTAHELAIDLRHRHREIIEKVRAARSVSKVMLLHHLERLEADLGSLSAMLSNDSDLAGGEE